MSDTAAIAKPRTAKSIGFLVLKILLAVLFFAAAGAKLSGMQKMVAEFGMVGLGQWFRYFTAATEITGAVLLLLPGRTFYGAVILAAVCVGAFFAQLLRIHQDVIHTIVLGGIMVAIAWAHRDQYSMLR